MKISDFHLRVGLLAITLGSVVWGFNQLIFWQMPHIFMNPQEDMSFGWYVPIFSLYVIWTERKQLIESLGNPSAFGMLATLPFLFLGFIGVRGIQVRFGVLAFAGLMLTIPWAFFGRATAARLLFPAAFMLFCIPLANFLDIVTVHLRLLSTAVASGIIDGIGVEVIRKGTTITLGSGFGLDVAAPCSGLRSIFALMALTAGYAYFNQPTWLRRGLLFILSIPLAIAGNVMRILTIALVAEYASGEFAMGFYHDYSGYVVFIVAIMLMLACGEMINRIAARLHRDKNGGRT